MGCGNSVIVDPIKRKQKQEYDAISTNQQDLHKQVQYENVLVKREIQGLSLIIGPKELNELEDDTKIQLQQSEKKDNFGENGQNLIQNQENNLIQKDSLQIQKKEENQNKINQQDQKQSNLQDKMAINNTNIQLKAKLSRQLSDYDNYMNEQQKIDEDFENQYSDQLFKDGIKLGEGAFGKVLEVFDYKNTKIMVRKQIKDQKSFEKEMKTYLNLQATIPSVDLDKYVINLKYCLKNQNSLFFETGLCSLKEYMEKLIEGKKKMRINNLKYIFKTISEFILLLKDYGLVHSDIKSDNAMLCDSFEEEILPDEKKTLKMIDLGNCNNKIQTSEFTPQYLKPPQRQKGPKDQPLFENEYQRYNAEFFCLYRSINELMLSTAEPTKENEKLIDDLLYDFGGQHLITNSNISKKIQHLWENASSQKQFLKLNKIAKAFYFYEIQQDLNINKTDLGKIMIILDNIICEKLQSEEKFEELRFLISQIDCENYLLEDRIDIKQKIDQSQQEQEQQELNEIGVCTLIIQNKRQKLKSSIENSQKLQGMDNYIQQNLALKEEEDKPENIYGAFELIKNHLQESQNINLKKQRITVILGRPGMGKSLFLLELSRKIHMNLEIEIKILELKNYNKFELLQKDIENLWKEKKKKYLVILLDGLDEFVLQQGLKRSQQQFNKVFNLSERLDLQIVVTGRIDTQSEGELIDWLKFPVIENSLEYIRPQIYYIIPFNESQQNEFIMKFIQTKKKILKFYIQPEIESNQVSKIEEYKKFFNSYQVIKEMSIRPFTLNIILQLFDKLKSI